MFKVYKKEIEVAGKKISLETGKVARQADGAIIAPSACLATLPVSKLIFFPATSISFLYTLNISFPFRFVPFRSIYLDFYFLKFNFDSTFL